MPIPLEVLRRVQVVYTHAHCPDGMATAMILKDAFRMLGTSPRIEFLAHGTPEHKEASRGAQEGWALWCDIAPDRDVVSSNPVRERCFAILDHHIGARDVVEMFLQLHGCGAFADEKLEPGVSGAVLAFRKVYVPALQSLKKPAELELHEMNLVREFAECVGARDTWQTQDTVRFKRGQWISKMLMSKPARHWLDLLFTYGDGSQSLHPPYLNDSEVSAGAALFDAHEEAVRQAVGQCVGMNVGDDIDKGDGRREPMRLLVFQEQASGFRLCSDVAEALRRQNDTYRNEPSVFMIDVVAGFFFVVDKPGAEPRLLYSLRGLNGFDVASFAKANGGGGHTAAAGFSVALDSSIARLGSPYEVARALLEDFVRHGQ